MKNYNVSAPKKKTKAKFNVGQVVTIDTDLMKQDNREFQKIKDRFWGKSVGWMYTTEAHWFAVENWIKPLTSKEAGQ